jgi:putative acetyltransferase
MIIREFRLGDEPALYQVFFSAIHEIASKDYTPQQVNAWAPIEIDREL